MQAEKGNAGAGTLSADDVKVLLPDRVAVIPVIDV